MISRLSQRDRVALAIGGAVILLTLIFLGVIAPYQSAMERMDNRITSRQKQLREVQALRQDYLRLQQQVGEMESRLSRRPDFSLFSFIEEVTIREGTKDRLVSVRPKEGSHQDGLQEEAVEIRLEKIGLNQLIQLLYQIAAADVPVQVRNLRVRTRFDDRSLLDATMDLSSYRKSS